MFGSSECGVELLSVSEWCLIVYSVFPGSQQRWDFLVVTSRISILLFTGVEGFFGVLAAPGNITLVSIQSIDGLCQTNQLYPRMVE